MGIENIELVGVLNQRIIDILKLDFEAGAPIYIGELKINRSGSSLTPAG